MFHDLQTIQQPIQILQIIGTQLHRGEFRLEVAVQCWHDRRFNGFTTIACTHDYDYCIRPNDPNTIEGGPNIAITVEPPLLWAVRQPHCRLKIDPAEAMADWKGQRSVLITAALWECHQKTAEGFIPFIATRDFRSSKPRNGLSTTGPQRLMQHYARVLSELGFHPTIEVLMPPGQWIPGGDGEMYDPPLDLRLLLLDRSWVIAEGFQIEEVKQEREKAPDAHLN